MWPGIFRIIIDYGSMCINCLQFSRNMYRLARSTFSPTGLQSTCEEYETEFIFFFFLFNFHYPTYLYIFEEVKHTVCWGQTYTNKAVNLDNLLITLGTFMLWWYFAWLDLLVHTRMHVIICSQHTVLNTFIYELCRA